ncbi:MAG TPA: MliC family protein [Quisquiliibacterium sp.]|nr:MliC family protein [Quisquiliibacterium sp.]
MPQALPHTAARAEPPAPPPSLAVGLYRCDLQRSVTVRRIAPDRGSIVLGWLGQDHGLRSMPTSSGALRYEDPVSGLTWLVISGKSMLLDSRRGRQLANDCRL